MKKLLILLALIPSLGMAQGTTVRATKSTGVLLTPSNFFTGNSISTTTFAEAAATNSYNWAVLDAPGSGSASPWTATSGGTLITATNDHVIIGGASITADSEQFAVSNDVNGVVMGVDEDGDWYGVNYLSAAKGDLNPSINFSTSAITILDAWGDTSITIGNSGVQINPNKGIRADLRVSGDTESYLLWADAGFDKVGFLKIPDSAGSDVQISTTLDVDNQSGGTLSVSNSTTNISVDDTAYVMLTNWDRNDEFSNLTAETGNDSMTATIAGSYLVTVSMDFNGLDNDYYHVAVFKEGVIVPYATANQSPPEYTSKMSVGITSLITLAIGDTLDVRMIRDGAGSPSSPVLRAGTFTAIKVR